MDKLDLISKWVIVPKLVLGREFPRDSQAFEYLINIKKERDKLVHSKSKPELTDEQRKKELEKYDLKPSKNLLNNDTDRNINVFQWLVDIFLTLKMLERESGQCQDWWQVLQDE